MLLLSDYRYAARSLVRAPGFALLTICTLGLGIGANTAIFSALYRLQFAPVPFAGADRLVNLSRTNMDEGFFLSPTPAVVAAWQAHAQTLEHVAYTVQEDLTLTGTGDPVVVKGARISPELLQAVSQAPLIGRAFTAEDAASDVPAVLLSERLWRERFGADASVIGRALELGGRSMTVVGVMPARFARFADPFPRHDLWVPFVPRPGDFGNAIGLVRAGVTLDVVSAELQRIAADVEETTSAQQSWSYRALPISEMLGFGSRKVLPILLGAVGLVLLIACANVAALMIVRLHARRREIAIRSALGARGRRILAGIAAEQALLALGAGTAGLLLAVWTMDIIARFQPDGMPLLDTLALDPAVLLFAAVLLVTAVTLSGIVPAWAALRRDPADALRSGGDRVTAGSAVRSVLVTGQIAVSVMLLVGAALLIRSYAEISTRALGFDPDDALAVVINLPEARYSAEQRATFFRDLVEGVRQVPGVKEAAIGGGAPPHFGLLFASLRLEDSDASTDGINFVAGTSTAPGFLPALGVTFVEGGDFRPEHRDMQTVIVNRTFIERFWPGESGVGKRMRIGPSPEAPWIDIIGVVEDVRGSLRNHDELQVFYPIEWSHPGHTLLVRSAGVEPLSLLPAVRQIMRRLDADLPIREAATLQQRMHESLSRERFVMVLLGVFAALAFLLTIVGLYGLVAYTVQQRVREIGIRVALGATPRAVRELFIAHGMRLVVAGTLAGLVGAVAGVSVLRSLVHGITVYDGASFVAAIALIAPATLLASWLPARRAAHVDPSITLTSD